MQGNMFEHQKNMAYLNAELRGYKTAGSGYGLNAAGGSVTVNNYNTSSGGGSSNSSPGASTGSYSATTPGPKQQGQGLGYGQTPEQARMFKNSGASTSYGSIPGTSQQMTGADTPIQPFEHRGTGAARSVPSSAANNWLNRNVVSAAQGVTPMSQGIKPATNFTQGVSTGGARAAATSTRGASAAMGGPAGLMMMAGEEMAKQQRSAGRGFGSIGSALFR